MNWHATRLLAYENQIMPEHRVVRPKLDLLGAMIGSCFDFRRCTREANSYNIM